MHHVFFLGHILNWAPIAMFVVVAIWFRRLQAGLSGIPPLARFALWLGNWAAMFAGIYFYPGHPHA
jgi:hypothetical protein